MILKGCTLQAADSRNINIPSAAWGDNTRLGVSMGPNDNHARSATFSGFIKLLNKRGEWHRFGLTCYHAVLPSYGQNDEEEPDSEMKKCKISILSSPYLCHID